MDARDADEILAGDALVPFAQGSIPYIKELVHKCLEADIPATAGSPPGAGKGWGTKIHLLVREVDIARVSQLMHDDWLAMLAREGTAVPLGAGSMPGDDPDADPPCPACGTAAPLVAGECSECGLFLGW